MAEGNASLEAVDDWDDLKARYYRWWTVRAWREADQGGVKLGPLTIGWYLWIDERLRVSWSFNFGREHIVYGGPLT